MNDNFEQELIKTSINITFPDDEKVYACYYNPSNEKCYYSVNKEFLMIVNPAKIREVKAWYEGSKKKKSKIGDEEE